ncbi:aminoglycoside 6-adenylyltransferase [Dictyobacter arantiisoli]|uniref:Aminoglycoside 6-adenylyltransferase n=1 Tax=Dictyobacter arantiisoli TaxID=2014874 RepID=A0A5A5TKK2_9CHLR|nr:aminoglycoside 6-adenylyltransferase [Dictyobacter arantiisoli]GCF11795.1 hypothetical protein KDI_53590 [Dictyobacter arantiisoli]
MSEYVTRGLMLQRLVDVARTDQRIVGLVDYGSSSYRRADEWSDIDVALFVRDADFEAFNRAWKEWAAQFGELLLAYRGGIGHPWTVYAAQPVPLRVDFNFYPEAEIGQILTWPNSPSDSAAMICYEGSGGRLTETVQQIVGRSLRLPSEDIASMFEQVAGDFWYYVLYMFSKWKRDQVWLARQTFHGEVMQNLLALLRLEANALDEWRSTSAAWRIEQMLSPERLQQLDACIPASGAASLKQSLVAAANMGYEACEHIAHQYCWTWPWRVAEHTLQVISA